MFSLDETIYPMESYNRFVQIIFNSAKISISPKNNNEKHFLLHHHGGTPTAHRQSTRAKTYLESSDVLAPHQIFSTTKTPAHPQLAY